METKIIIAYEANLYNFVINNGVNIIDPRGLQGIYENMVNAMRKSGWNNKKESRIRKLLNKTATGREIEAEYKQTSGRIYSLNDLTKDAFELEGDSPTAYYHMIFMPDYKNDCITAARLAHEMVHVVHNKKVRVLDKFFDPVVSDVDYTPVYKTTKHGTLAMECVAHRYEFRVYSELKDLGCVFGKSYERDMGQLEKALARKGSGFCNYIKFQYKYQGLDDCCCPESCYTHIGGKKTKLSLDYYHSVSVWCGDGKWSKRKTAQ